MTIGSWIGVVIYGTATVLVVPEILFQSPKED